MILVDASVWIDFFNGASNKAVHQLNLLLQEGTADLATADLVVFEVLRGFRHNKSMMQAQALLTELAQVELGGLDNALRAVEHYRALRGLGYSIRSPIDVLLAAYCIAHDHVLLHRDADFDVLQTLRGLQVLPH